jgi:transposase
VSGAKSDAADAHVLADMVRTDSHQLRAVAGDTVQAAAVKVAARAHKTLIWERTRHVQRLRHSLRDYFPAALEAFTDLAAPDTLELLAKTPDPASAAKLTTAQITAALKRARRRAIPAKAAAIQAALRSERLGQPGAVAAAYAATVRAATAVLTVLNEQISTLEGQVEAHFGQHPDAEIIGSQPGLGAILGARVLAEFGDDPHRYADARSRKDYAGTSPITRSSGKKKAMLARCIHNDRLIDALTRQAFTALTTSPGARAYYDQLRGRGVSHYAALRQLANRLVGILHGCLKTRTLYDEATAWPQQTAKAERLQLDIQAHGMSFEPRHGEAPAGRHVVRKPDPNRSAGGSGANPTGTPQRYGPGSLPSRPDPQRLRTIRRLRARSPWPSPSLSVTPSADPGRRPCASALV